ncbi:MAG: carboxylic acid reductase [Mycobacterium sp.]
MPTDTREERLARRIAELYATDAQFAETRPSQEVNAKLQQPDLRLSAIAPLVLQGYSDRPALGQRATQIVTDAATGRTSAKLLPGFDTISYGELWQRVQAVTNALAGHPVRPGDRVATLGFNSIEYAIIDIALGQLGAVAVPLHNGAPIAQLGPIVAEAEPAVIAAGVDYLPDAVNLVLTWHSPVRLVVFDVRAELDDHREALESATSRLAQANNPVIVETLADLSSRGSVGVPPAVSPPAAEDPLALLIYTSGSTGDPKGAMYGERVVANSWKRSAIRADGETRPSITLNFMPMSHTAGRGILYGTLGAGGTAYFVAMNNLSTFLTDLALVRPTQLDFVPRIWDMLFGEFQKELDRRSADGDDFSDPAKLGALKAEVMAEQRQKVLGGRYLNALSGSAPLSPEMKKFVEAYTDLHMVDAYGSTETGVVFIDGRVLRPPVTDYRLVDVPELGYFHTDRPYPRGELTLKSQSLFPGYYKRPLLTAQVFDADGYYHTGDIVAEVDSDQLVYLDRRNNVLKLSQGEFVAVSKLEALFERSPLVRQIYLYGNSARSYLLAVVVPTEDALSGNDENTLRQQIIESLQQLARGEQLQAYEVPRDIIIESTAFTQENGLLTGLRKVARPKLKERYAERLEQLYAELAASQTDELRELRRHGAERPVLETVIRAAGALLRAAAGEMRPDAHFTDLGGDSLSGLTFANLLQEIFGVEVPVGVIIGPATDLRELAEHIGRQRQSVTEGPTFATVHGAGTSEVHAADLKLSHFIDEPTLAAAPTLARPIAEVRTVLLTGATGFLGRYLTLQYLERLDLVGGKLICLVRAKDDDDARARLDKIFDSGDPELLRHYTDLASEHLEVIAGDKGEANLGLTQQVWDRLADTVDLIVDPAALVNHVLPYSQLFAPNTLGTAELIRVALTTRLKPIVYVSTIGVGVGVEPSKFTEDVDIRVVSAMRTLNTNDYANGYCTSKWAGEVVLREAHDLCLLPVSVFRCDMILAEPRYAGQLNVPDMFTRLMLSLVATGIAPGSFYELDEHDNRQRAHYDGLPVDFIAEAICTLAETEVGSLKTYHVWNPHDDGIGLDEYVDWLIDAGFPIQRMAEYAEWLRRFETAMRALPEKQRQASLLPLLHNYQRPLRPINGSIASAERFRSAVQEAKVGTDKDIPHVTPSVITKYITDLTLLGLL